MNKRTLLYTNRHPQMTWTVNLRRLTGKPKIVSVLDVSGNKLRHWSEIIGDKLIVVLKDGPSSGSLRISLKGETALYMYKPSLWKRFKNFWARLFNRSIK
jgi:hypothetical protein